jgi:hypothetical protein
MRPNPPSVTSPPDRLEPTPTALRQEAELRDSIERHEDVCQAERFTCRNRESMGPGKAPLLAVSGRRPSQEFAVPLHLAR